MNKPGIAVVLHLIYAVNIFAMLLEYISKHQLEMHSYL